ncbi:MAG: App1 family protein [Flammeovirgaceae bacterium]
MNALKKLLHRVEGFFDRKKNNTIQNNALIENIHLLAYHGYGNEQQVHLKGRVLKGRALAESTADDGIFKNIRQMYKRFHSIELPNISVTVTFQGETREIITDEEGYYTVSFPMTRAASDAALWHQIRVKLTRDGDEAYQTAWVQTPQPQTSFGVISDIDDTILQTGATDLFDAILTTFTKNATTRLSFPGVRELYQGLQKGTASHAVNPFFYLSNSPWNLFDFIDEFLQLKEIPRGSVLLRDYGIDKDKFVIDYDHKLNAIKTILRTYPDMPFILIGDSGEKDPEYYQQIAQQFTERILAIYIRDVSDDERDEAVLKIAEQVEAMGVPMLFMADSYTAAAHAAHQGWIDPKVKELIKSTLEE